MPYIKNLKVNKISFVRAAANKREFLLCKSAEGGTENKAEETNAVVITDAEGNEVTLGVDVPTTTTINVEKRGGSCNGDGDGGGKKDKLNKEEEKEGETNMPEDVKKEGEKEKEADVTKASTPDVAATLQKMQDENAAMKAENATLRADINKMADNTRRNEIRSILKSDAPLAPIDVEETVEMLMGLEKSGNNAASEKLIASFKKTSEALKSSGSFGEIGSSRADAPSPTNDYVASINRSVVEVAKGANGKTNAEVFIEALKKSDPSQYEKYRRQPQFRSAISDFE